MKILQVPTYSGRSGLSLHVLTLSTLLRDRGHEVRVLSMADGPLIGEFNRQGIQAAAIPDSAKGGRRNPLYLWNAAAHIRRTIAEFRPDVIHSHGPQAHLLTILSRPPRQSAFVASAHGSFSQFAAGHVAESGLLSSTVIKLQYGAVDRLAGWRADSIVAVSHFTARELVGSLRVPNDKVTVIPNGIMEAEIEPEQSASLRAELLGGAAGPLIVFVGRIGFHKGCQDLIDAALKVLDERPECRFVLVGEGPMSSELQGRVQAAGCGEGVRFTGARPDALSIVAASDFMVLPSLSEGLPLTLLEAAMLGKPMVASSVGGIPEIVKAGQTGLLVPPRSPERLAQAILRIAADEAWRKSAGTAARNLWQREFRSELMVERMERLYREKSGSRD